jgi:hypothetical protein
MARSEPQDPFEPTHTVPAGGLATYEEADPDRPTTPLDPGLEVAVAERHDDWVRVVCSNGWSTWVDGGQLVPMGRPAGSLLLDDDLSHALGEALAQVAVLVGDLKAGRINDGEFRREAFRSGLVIRDSEAWILDLSSERWWRYDGVGLTTIEVPASPTGEG